MFSYLFVHDHSLPFNIFTEAFEGSFFKNVSVLCNNVRSSTLPDISFIFLSHFIETHTQIAAVASATLPKQLNRRKTFISSNEYIKFSVSAISSD